MMNATKPDKSISITDLEQELQTDAAFDEMECGASVPTYIDPEGEPTNLWQITTDGIHEITPSKLTTWVNDDVEMFWISFS